MQYKFECRHCRKYVVRNIKIEDYDDAKDNQICRECNFPLKRVIEWEGPANNLGGYSEVGGRAKWQ